MFEKEQEIIQSQIMAILEENGLPAGQLKWSLIPFSGHWGISTSMFTTASLESKTKKGINIKTRAAEIAELVVGKLDLPDEFEKGEAVNGYVNLYFDSSLYAKHAVDNVLEQAEEFRPRRRHRQDRYGGIFPTQYP